MVDPCDARRGSRLLIDLAIPNIPRGALMLHLTRSRTVRLAAAGLSFALSLVAAGCGADANMPKLGKVHGKVTYKGQPVTSGHITFTPVLGKGGETGQTATGEINTDGTYEMTTFNTGDGAILGQHTVTVVVRGKENEALTKPDANGHIRYELAKAVTPSKYASAETSPLKCTVHEGTQDFDIELKD
jgi:hypothetical protein